MHLSVATRSGALVSTRILRIEHQGQSIIIMEPVSRLSAERIAKEVEWIAPQIADSLKVRWTRSRFILRTPCKRPDDRFTGFEFHPMLDGIGPHDAGVAGLAQEPGPLETTLTRDLQLCGAYTFTEFLDVHCVFRSALFRTTNERVHAYDGERYYRRDGRPIGGTLDGPSRKAGRINQTDAP